MALVSCFECRKTISDKAASCPHCGAPQDVGDVTANQYRPAPAPYKRKRPWLRVALIGFVLGGGLVLLVGNSDPPSQNVKVIAASAPAAPQRDPIQVKSAGKEIVTATAQELFDAYETNEVAADRWLKNKIVLVSGRIQSVDKSLFDAMFVSLETRNQFMPTKVRPNKPEAAKIAALRRGQSVVFRCTRMSRWVGSPMGEDCALMSTEAR